MMPITVVFIIAIAIVTILFVVFLVRKGIINTKKPEANPYMKKGLAGPIIVLAISIIALIVSLRFFLMFIATYGVDSQALWLDNFVSIIIIAGSIVLIIVYLALIMRRSQYNRMIDARYMEMVVSAAGPGISSLNDIETKGTV